MITHDVDEAIYLADRVVLMTNGPNAVLAEILDNPLPRERKRSDVHKHPLYYGVRNHIIDFLWTSKNRARCRRLAKDWENLNRQALAFSRLASIHLMLRNYAIRPKLSGQTLRACWRAACVDDS
jgi:hypothetical protein